MDNSLLYNKYRPKRFDEVYGNFETTDILRSLVKNKGYRNVHIIFSGLPGNAKTTLSRIFSRAINCLDNIEGEPCNICTHCVSHLNNSYVDYLELDGTTYNKVEDAKRLVDLAKQYPVNSSYQRIIMLDEAHALSNQAFDKFLLLLESSDLKTTFLFSSTDIHLFRPAIISRCFTFDIKPLSSRDISKNLIKICESEGIEYTVEAINRLSFYYNRKPRDAIKALDLEVRSKGCLKSFTLESQESLLLDIFKLAFFNKVTDFELYFDKLNTKDIYISLSRMLNEVFFSNRLPLFYLESSKVDGFKDLFKDSDIIKIMKDLMLYKPNDTYSLSLFLSSCVIPLGFSSKENKESQNSYKGRRFVATNLNNKVVEKPKLNIQDLKKHNFSKIGD